MLCYKLNERSTTKHYNFDYMDKEMYGVLSISPYDNNKHGIKKKKIIEHFDEL